MKLFYFDVEADLAHFRDPLSHAFFNTFIAPPTHSIIGFIGNCCGFSEKETEDKLADILNVGCKILYIKGYLKDLVIIRNQKENKNIGTPRTRKFLVNPKYRIYVGCSEENIIKEIRNHIISPCRTPYLGISDCIAYIHNISTLRRVEKTKIKNTDCIISMKKKYLEYNKKNINNVENVELYQQLPNYSTTIKEEKSLTIYPQITTTPRSYFITENEGRKPKLLEQIIMSVNCILNFSNDIDGYVIDNENIFLT